MLPSLSGLVAVAVAFGFVFFFGFGIEFVAGAWVPSAVAFFFVFFFSATIVLATVPVGEYEIKGCCSIGLPDKKQQQESLYLLLSKLLQNSQQLEESEDGFDMIEFTEARLELPDCSGFGSDGCDEDVNE